MLYQSQAELGLANETIASALSVEIVSIPLPLTQRLLGQNLALQDELYRLRSETKDAFDEAKALEARWAELQREQKEIYQVRHSMASRWLFYVYTNDDHSDSHLNSYLCVSDTRRLRRMTSLRRSRPPLCALRRLNPQQRQLAARK